MTTEPNFLEQGINTIQPIQDDFFTDGHLDQFARIDHQHPLSNALKARLFGSGGSRNRNLLHNGNFQVNQRIATSITMAGSGTFLCDRWQPNNNAVGTSVANVTTAAGFGPLTPVGRPKPVNIQYMQQTVIDAALAAGDYIVLAQGIEGLNLQHLQWGTANAQPLVLSFDFYSSVVGTYAVEFLNNGRFITKTFTVSTAGVWATYTVSIPGDTGGAIVNDNASRLGMQFFIAAGSTFTSGTLQSNWGTSGTAGRATGVTNTSAATLNSIVAVTNVQLEIGTTATTFEIVPYDEDLSSCRRYFERKDSLLQANTPFATGMCLGGVSALCFMMWDYKRSTPTLVFNAVANWALMQNNGALVVATSIADGGQASQVMGRVNVGVAAGLVLGQPTMLYSATVTTAIVTISADI